MCFSCVGVLAVCCVHQDKRKVNEFAVIVCQRHLVKAHLILIQLILTPSF